MPTVEEVFIYNRVIYKHISGKLTCEDVSEAVDDLYEVHRHEFTEREFDDIRERAVEEFCVKHNIED